jgi:hypothetical protein
MRMNVGEQYNGKNNTPFLSLYTGNGFITISGAGEDIPCKCP